MLNIYTLLCVSISIYKAIVKCWAVEWETMCVLIFWHEIDLTMIDDITFGMPFNCHALCILDYNAIVE